MIADFRRADTAGLDSVGVALPLLLDLLDYLISSYRRW